MASDGGHDSDAELENERRRPTRTIRIELLIATLALLASSVASVATLLQTRTIGDQFGVSVWPYLVADHGFSRTGFELGYTNDGLGPAIVREFHVTVDGRSQSGWYAAARRFDASHRLRLETERDFGAGRVLRPGESYTILVAKLNAQTRASDDASTAQMSPTAKLMQRMVNRIELTTCYCSLLGKCWRLRSSESQPQPVSSCGEPTPLFTL